MIDLDAAIRQNGFNNLEEFNDLESVEIINGFFIPIIILSAKSEEALKETAFSLKSFIEKNKSRNE